MVVVVTFLSPTFLPIRTGGGDYIKVMCHMHMYTYPTLQMFAMILLHPHKVLLHLSQLHEKMPSSAFVRTPFRHSPVTM